MAKNKVQAEKGIDDFLVGKSDHTRELFNHLVQQFQKAGSVTLHPAKTMIGIATPRKRIAYITQFGKNFIHVVFMFRVPYNDNLLSENSPGSRPKSVQSPFQDVSKGGYKCRSEKVYKACG
jgi:hypothetical protein